MPSNFMCLILKLLQIQPDQEVIRAYILQEDSKYLRLLGAFYLRLTGKADQVQLPIFSHVYSLRLIVFCLVLPCPTCPACSFPFRPTLLFEPVHSTRATQNSH